MASSSSAKGKRRAQDSAIDVDEFAKKFEPSSDDIIAINPKDFRQSVRDARKKSEPACAIGSAIRQAREAQQRRSASVSTVKAQSISTPAAKRQKTEHQPSVPRDRILAEHRTTRSPSASSSIERARVAKRPAATIEVTDSESGEEVAKLLRHRPAQPNKRTRTNAPPRPPPPRPPVARQPEVIELDSDASDVHMQPVEEESDWEPPGWDLMDEERWTPMPANPDLLDNITAGLQSMKINHVHQPTPSLLNSSRTTDNTTRFRPRPVVQSSRNGKPEYVWEMLPAAFRPRSRPRFTELPSQAIIRTWADEYQPFFSATCTGRFKEAPGAINNIQQNGRWTVVTSGCVGGTPDEDEEDRDPYNHSGSLVVYDTQSRTHEVPIGHVRKYARKSDPATNWTKHYAVHDAQFNPLWDSFASSSADKSVNIWTQVTEEEEEEEEAGQERDQQREDEEQEDFGMDRKTVWRKRHALKFSYPPNQLSFRPVREGDEESLLAVGEKRIRLYSLTPDLEPPSKLASFRLFSKRDEAHVAGTIVWGRGPTANCLFASSEPDPLKPKEDVPQFVGRHKMVELREDAGGVHSTPVVHDLEAQEAGDSLCINSSGTLLALTTRAEDRSILRLFDVSRKSKSPCTTISLEPYPTPAQRGFEGYEGEVTCAAFSPDDGVLLALARNDNTTHVYDVRYLDMRYSGTGMGKGMGMGKGKGKGKGGGGGMGSGSGGGSGIGRGPLYRLEHTGECRAAGREKYGVAKVEWVRSEVTRRVALVSAGEDGCVRLWDPLKAMDEDNGKIIAEHDSDIAYFSIGDPYRGENRLVVGDLSAQVSVYNTPI